MGSIISSLVTIKDNVNRIDVETDVICPIQPSIALSLPTSSETETKAVEEIKSEEFHVEEIFEKYTEPSGTKVTVDPAEVASSADVIKKNKNKKKDKIKKNN